MRLPPPAFLRGEVPGDRSGIEVSPERRTGNRTSLLTGKGRRQLGRKAGALRRNVSVANRCSTRKRSTGSAKVSLSGGQHEPLPAIDELANRIEVAGVD